MPGYACWKLWSRFLSSEGRPRMVSKVRASSGPSRAIQADAVHARRHIPVSDHAPEADRRGQSAGADGLPARAVPAASAPSTMA